MAELSRILWDSLLELDDLSASTACIMELLCTLLSQNPSLFSTHHHADHHHHQLLSGTSSGAVQPTMLTLLVPRLWPFLSHTITSVRLSCLKALLTLFRADGYDKGIAQVTTRVSMPREVHFSHDMSGIWELPIGIQLSI